MPSLPDHPDFTAAALGEASPEELAAFAAGLAENPAWLTEADALRETARRLAAALRQDPAPMSATGGAQLTAGQRQAVLSAGAALPEPSDSPKLSASPAPSRTGKPLLPFPAAARPSPLTVTRQTSASASPATRHLTVTRHTPGSPVPAGRPPGGFRRLPAAAGLAAAAAAVILGIFTLSGPPWKPHPHQQQSAGNPGSSLLPQGASQLPPSPAQTPEGIPAIALDPAATARKTGFPSSAPAPAPDLLPAFPEKSPVLNPGSPLTTPSVPPPASGSIATAPPDLRIPPAPPGRTRNPEPAAEPVPGPRRNSPPALAAPAAR